MSVAGVFRERIERHALIRYFQRIFVIIPSTIGFCIVNEQLHITCATPEQIKMAFKGGTRTFRLFQQNNFFFTNLLQFFSLK